MSLINRAKGALLGLAIGDALGTTNEFCAPEETTKLTTDGFIGKGPFNLSPGQWTDDTSMALCMGQSIIDHGFDLNDQMRQYAAWLDTGHMSCTGRCFDIGITTYDAIRTYQQKSSVLFAPNEAKSSGNGGIMRLAPAAILMHSAHVSQCALACEMQSTPTHASIVCREAASYMGTVMHRLLNEYDKHKAITPAFHRAYTCGEMHEIESGAYVNYTLDSIFKRGGYVINSLRFALWCLLNTTSFEECVLTAANAGGDADTNAAIAGQLAGAYYGVDAIPEAWKKDVAWRDVIEHMAKRLALIH